MVKNSERDMQQIADDITNYLARHANAADTLEGITKWWLLRQRIEDSSVQVQQALEYLCDKGEIKSVQAGGKTIYSAAQQAVKEMRKQEKKEQH